MNLSNFGAVRLPFLAAAVLALLAAPVSSQVVEKGRTLADLIATHPCDASKADRIARVTDCDAADDIGDGGGAFQCWASCDGSAPWVTQAIGGGGGGGEATSVQGSATLPGTCTELDIYQDTDSGGTEFYVCTATNTWTKAGTIGGTLTATDDLAVCTDGTGGFTIGACTVLNLDNLRLDGNTLSSTNTNGNINLTPNGTGSVIPPITTVGGTSATLGMASAYGFSFKPGGNIAILANATTGKIVFIPSTGVVSLGAGGQFGWTSGTNGDPDYYGIDTSFARHAAGVIRATDGGTGIRSFQGGGAAVASATAMPVPTGRVFHVTGTTTITSITSTNFQSGACVSLIFDDVLTFTDGSNLKLAGNFVTTADDTISLCYDGTNWYETGRSVN